MTLGTKIASGFGSLIAISLVLGGLGVYNMKNVEGDSAKLAKEYVPEVEYCTDLERSSLQTMYAMRGYGLTQEQRYYDQGMKELENVDHWLQKCDELAKEAEHLEKLGPAVKAVREQVGQYRDLVAQTVELDQKMAANRTALDEAAAVYVENCTRVLDEQNKNLAAEIAADAEIAKLEERHFKITEINNVIDLGNATRIAAFKSQALRDPQLIRQANGNFAGIEKMIREIREVTYEAHDLEALDNVQMAANDYQSAMNKFLTNWEANVEVGRQRNKVGDELLAVVSETSAAGVAGTREIANEAESMLKMASLVMIVGLAIALVVGSGLAFVIARSITKPIQRIIEGLTAGSEQTASAAGQVSSASQSLAEGASEAAASIEETTANVTEMAAMTKKSAENASEARNLTGQTESGAAKGTEAMKRMSAAINDIKQSSDETSKIIKTIDEIAFQTNLLALNAAVEAARAGDAGKGFAVVAEEVRNLAQRSADAAKDTATLIEGSVGKAETGVEISQEVGAALDEIATLASQVNEFVGQIADASNEQSRGIDEVNSAVAQLDQVTQQNAANAEESASAAEELSSQSEQLSSMVGDLVRLVGGSRDANMHASIAHEHTPQRTSGAKITHLHDFAKKRDQASKRASEEAASFDEEQAASF